MNDFSPHPRAGGPLPATTSDEDTVAVRTRVWCTAVMITVSAFMCLVQTSFAATRYINNPVNAMYVWFIASSLLAFAFPFLLLARDKHPEPVFWICCAVVLIFPYDPMLMLMALTSLIARRRGRQRIIRAIVAATLVGVWGQMRDTLRPFSSSMWQSAIFIKPDSDVASGHTVMLAGRPTIIATAVVVELIAILIAILAGLYIRSRVQLDEAAAKTQAISDHAASLQRNLTDQQLADAIAAEAHDTLAHSLSLIALNASALQGEALAFIQLADATNPHETGQTLTPELRNQASLIEEKSEEIRRQSAGALDEAHSIIGMLRHPQQARQQLAPAPQTSMTRQSLDALINDARSAGMRINTWIDIQQLSDLDEGTGKIAYRAIQEGLTNARRHAEGEPVSVEVTMNPGNGIRIHISNPMKRGLSAPNEREVPSATDGNGLAGLTARVQTAGGTCRYGHDDHHVFHLDVAMPWIARQADRMKP